MVARRTYLYAIGEEREPRFDFLIPYGTYVKEKTRKYKNDIKNVKNSAYREDDDLIHLSERTESHF